MQPQMALPHFIYHPEPLRTGSIEKSEKVCEVCNRPRGFTYTAGSYGVAEISALCPWCIADGSAHERFGVEFTDRELIGGGWEPVAAEVADEVAYRTPGFSGWQQERWFTHCGDAGEFIGPMGKAELEALGQEAIEVIRRECGYDDSEWNEYYSCLDAEHGPATAYLFRCRHCGKLGGYSDCH